MKTSNVYEKLTDNNDLSNVFEWFAVRAIISDFVEICDLFKFAAEYYNPHSALQSVAYKTTGFISDTSK